MFKKHVAQRKLKNRCIYCEKHFVKGDVYYKERHVNVDGYRKIYSYNLYECPKCKYEREQHEKRYKAFQKICVHPEEFINLVWGYIPGECVKEPKYNQCRLCGKIL